MSYGRETGRLWSCPGVGNFFKEYCQRGLLGVLTKYHKQTLEVVGGLAGCSIKGILRCLLGILSSTEVSFQFSSALPQEKKKKSKTVFQRTRISGKWIRKLYLGPPERKDPLTYL